MTIWVLHIAGNVDTSQPSLILPLEEKADYTNVSSFRELCDRLRFAYPDVPPEAIGRKADMIWLYTHGISKEDIIALPSGKNVFFAEALSGVKYTNGKYIVPIRWFSRNTPIHAFGKNKRIFTYYGTALHEVTIAAEREAIRAHLPLPGNRWRRWKGLVVAMGLLQLFYMVYAYFH